MTKAIQKALKKCKITAKSVLRLRIYVTAAGTIPDETGVPAAVALTGGCQDVNELCLWGYLAA